MYLGKMSRQWGVFSKHPSSHGKHKQEQGRNCKPGTTSKLCLHPVTRPRLLKFPEASKNTATSWEPTTQYPPSGGKCHPSMRVIHYFKSLQNIPKGGVGPTESPTCAWHRRCGREHIQYLEYGVCYLAVEKQQHWPHIFQQKNKQKCKSL